MSTSATSNLQPKPNRLSAWSFAWSVITILLFALFAHRAWYIPETDYVAYYNAGLRALQGTNLYLPDPTPFKYLPVASYWFIPLSWIPFQVSKLIFFFISFGLGVWVYRDIWGRIGNWGTLAVLAAMIRFHNYDFLNSQVNHVLLFLLMVYLNRRRAQPVLAAFLFAVFASFKIVPIIALAPLLFLGRIREIAWILVWFAVLSLVPVLTFQDGIHTYSNWYQLMRATTELPAPSDQTVQSIQGALWYWVGTWLPQTKMFTALIAAVQALLLGWCCIAARRLRNLGNSSRDENAILVAAVALSVVISPLAWKHNFLLMLPGFVILIERGQRRVALAAFLLMTGVAAIIGPISIDVADRSYATLVGGLVLYIALLMPKSTATPPAASAPARRSPAS